MRALIPMLCLLTCTWASAQSHRYLSMAAFKEYRGEYTLENGQVLTISNRGQQPVARLGQGPLLDIAYASGDTFASLGSSLRIRFLRGRWGELESVEVSVNAPPPASNGG